MDTHNCCEDRGCGNCSYCYGDCNSCNNLDCEGKNCGNCYTCHVTNPITYEVQSQNQMYDSQNVRVRKWVMETPMCSECNYPMLCTFSGLRNEYCWPQCSNHKCVGYGPKTFILLNR